jgi:hypothetical protein
VAVLAFGFGYALCVLVAGTPYIGPLSFLVAVILAWDLGLVAAFAWVGLIHFAMPLLLALAGTGPFFVFSQARGAVFAILASSLVVDLALVYLTARLRLLHEQLARSKAEVLKTNAHLQAALAEVKELRGMLPICAWCKKIRDDIGKWEQLESYLARHSRATFTHGICPECLDGQLDPVRTE